MIIPDITKLKGTQFTEKHFQFHYSEFLEFLNEKYKNMNLTFQEKLYWYFNNITKHPICKYCEKETTFINARIGYREYCSRKCLNSDPYKKALVKKTCIEKYGGVAPACDKEIRKKMQQTNLKKYGVENAMQNKIISNKSQQTNIKLYGGCGNASDKLKEKQKATLINKYGVDNYAQTKECHDKIKQTCLKLYGVDHPSKTNSVRNKILLSRRKTEISRKDYLIGYTPNGDWICKCPHEECKFCNEKYFIIQPGYFVGRVHDCTELCTKLLPIGCDNTKNTSIELFVQQILDKHNIQYETNVRGVMGDKKELDIYIPSKQFAIECNGVLSHCTKYKDQHYHENKTIRCNENNIRLLHIWEDWIRWKPDIVKSMILSKLGLSENRLFARKCVVEQCTNRKEYADFMEKNHIQGKSGFEIGYGLRFNGKLVSVMTFGHKRGAVGSKTDKGKSDEFELIRFCSLLNTQVVGAAGKLFNHFIQDYRPAMVYSYASNDISDGGVYKKLGFESDGQINKSYWYIDPKTLIRYHRTSFTKNAIVKKGIKEKNDGTWTEHQAMDEAGYLRIYDSGQTKWIKYINKNSD